MSGFVCAYMGVPGDCQECGGFDPTGTGFCSHDCAAARAERAAQLDAALADRRTREDSFARECERLRGQGYTDREIDALLVGMPT